MPTYDFSTITTVNFNGNEVYEVRLSDGTVSQLGYQKILTYFNPQSGTPTPDPAYYYANRTYGSLPSVTRSGYTFDGWFTASSGGSLVTTSTTVSNVASGYPPEQTLYAQWTSSGYTLAFNDLIVNDFFGQTNMQTIPMASTIHATVTMSSGDGKIVWDKNVLGTPDLWDSGAYVTRTLSFAQGDTLSFIFVTFTGMSGTITLRMNDASGAIIDTFTYYLTG